MTISPPDSSILRFQLPWEAAERYSSCVCVCRGGEEGGFIDGLEHDLQ